ncbi:helix-turn-helix domain-containing protein [Streptomyces sp. TRM66268-LWL]|uniref:Helix-turn-helix domain-containing protein n=1 Tax=Streptomyces polyasparticus TaxID=2767826 RepID=A0ABR7SJH8_9ACTN|nr:helix-turn-helix domain-containing protein [Streptomyces polyasparticus]MBC9714641.1 helix-turn-helix domain-containing protein [Streptomyces polyasparticus]
MTTAAVQVLTVKEVMVRLRLGRSKVYDLIRTKRLHSYTEGRARRIPESSVEDYIRARLEEAA